MLLSQEHSAIYTVEGRSCWQQIWLAILSVDWLARLPCMGIFNAEIKLELMNCVKDAMASRTGQ